MWNHERIDIGAVKVGSSNIVTFIYTPEEGEAIQIANTGITTSCGCSQARWNSTTNTITVSFKPGPIPNHLRTQGWYITAKTITIYATVNGQSKKFELSFSAKITS